MNGPQRVLAAAPGWRMKTFEPTLDDEGQPIWLWPSEVETRISREALPIAGVVLDAEGNPRSSQATTRGFG